MEANQLADSLSKVSFGRALPCEVQVFERSNYSVVRENIKSLTLKNESMDGHNL